LDKPVAIAESSDHIELLITHLEAHRDPVSVPVGARNAAKKFLFDSLGVALAGTAVPQSEVLLAQVRTWGQGRDARVWGSDEYLPAPSAALINAFNIHNQEFDCVHERAVVHPMAVILAAMWAYAERLGNVSGPRFLAALALSVDVATVVGMCARKPIRFFRPAQCGCLGATAGMAVLGGFSANQMRDAFGIAYSQLAGTMQAHIEGTPTLALQVGFAARAAVCAVDLASAGFRGPHQVLDGKHGYFALFEEGAVTEPAFLELGKVWQIERVSHKPFPTGRAAHGGIAGVRALVAKHGFIADDVAAIILAAPPLIRQLVDRPVRADMNVSYARLCLPFLVATTLLEGTVGLDAYKVIASNSPIGAEFGAIAGRVTLVADSNTDVNALAPQHLTVKLKDGRVFEHAMPYVFGAPEAPMSPADQHTKFVDCCRHAKTPLNAGAMTRLADAVNKIENASDIANILTLAIA
jgi:aconitate decarboxylase